MILLYGPSDPRNYDSGYETNGFIFNLSTMKEGYETLQVLIPPNNIGHLTGYDFDVMYMNYIMNNDIVFMYFFRIIYYLYIGKDVFLLSSKDDWSENLIESLLKLIQQRYGINGIYVESEDDYIDAKLHGICDISPGYGVYNLDMDKNRFNILIENYLNTYHQLPFYISDYFGEDE